MAAKGAKATAKAAAPAAAVPPQAADRSGISKMLGVLKYNSEKGKDADKSTLASKALDVYKSLASSQERAQFLSDFENNGGGKNKDSLKFALTFKKTLVSGKQAQVSLVENWFTRLSHHLES